MTLDTLTRRLTAFPSFDALVAETRSGYRPTIQTHLRGTVLEAPTRLADALDAATAPGTAFRGLPSSSPAL